MKKIFTITLLVGIAFAGIAFAQGTTTTPTSTSTVDELPDPGILPGHPLYFVKSLTENIGLAFSFGNVKKSEQLANLAEKRLAEAEALADQGDSERAERALERYSSQFNRAIENARQAEESENEKIKSVLERVAESTAKHQKVLSEVYEKVPEQAREAISNAMEASTRGHNMALSAISGEKREEIQNRFQEARNQVDEKLDSLRNQGIPIPDFSQGENVGESTSTPNTEEDQGEGNSTTSPGANAQDFGPGNNPNN